MDLIGNYKDQEFGNVKLLILQEETPSSWNDIKDDLSCREKSENNSHRSQVVHKLYKIV